MNTINHPSIVDEVSEAFDHYEAALIANDVPALEAFFWDSPLATRFGANEELYGFEAIAAFRRNRIINFTRRAAKNIAIATFGNTFASVMYEYIATVDGGERHGRQSQTWAKFDEQWKIVAAHVSLTPIRPNEAVGQALHEQGVQVDPAWLDRIHENFAITHTLAQSLMEFEIPEQCEPAPVFQP